MRSAIIGLLALSLVGCATVQTLTTTTKNPITTETLANLEAATTVAFAGLNTYKRVCVAGTIPASCKDVIRNLQIYTRKVPPLLTSLRRFVKNNDQVNAVVVFASIQDLIAQFKTVAAQNNVVIP